MSAENPDGAGSQLFVLLPVHNRREITVRFVESLAKQSWRDFRLILIDDGSVDGTAEAVRAVWPRVEVVTGDGNWWWAGCLECGCAHVRRMGVTDDDVLLFMNDDVLIGPEFLAQAKNELAELPDTLLLARQVDAATGKEIDFGGGVVADLKQLRFTAAVRPELINCLPTRGLFLRWRDLERAGGFRSAVLPHYLSDYEFTIRARARGVHLRVAHTASLGVKLEHSGRSLKNLFSEPRARRFRLIFSQRYKDNPVTWSRFVRLAAPPGRRPYLLLKIWVNFLGVAVKSIVLPVQKLEHVER